jgi:hypothetical protein
MKEEDYHFLVRKTLTDLENKSSKDPNKKLGGYLVDLGQYHLDRSGYSKVAPSAMLLVPAAQALVATIRQECRSLLDGKTKEIHIIDSLLDYTKKYYREAIDDITALCKEAKKHI